MSEQTTGPDPSGRRMLSRRGLFGLVGGAAVAAAIGYSVPFLASAAQTGSLLTSDLPLPKQFTRRLPVPPVLRPGSHPDYPDADYYEITERVAMQEILPGVRTEIWGSNGMFPGPTIMSRTGRRTVIRRTNTLPVPTVTHLHGGHTPPDSDGFPTDLIYASTGPGAQPSPAAMMAMTADQMSGMVVDPMARTTVGQRIYDYPMHQRATTLWYHDHRMGFTAPDNYHGLAGFHLIHDDEEDALPLPKGARDMPLMITDRAFAADGSFHYPAVDPTLLDTPGTQHQYMAGVLGDVILVNGAPWPLAEVAAARHRLRFLNASNARRYTLALDPPPPGGGGLVQIGSDGGLLDRPIHHDSIDIAPAERFDVVVDFARYRVGQEVTLVNRLGTGSTAAVMRFRITHTASDDSTIPVRLATLNRLDPSQARGTRGFVFQLNGNSWTINGQQFDPMKPAATPKLDDTEIWHFNSDFHHSVHIHLTQFLVVSRNGGPPGPYDAGWKDTVDLRPAEQVSVIVRFTDYRGRYVMHCHNLEHEDMAMMATINVT
jgi:spore coat protein A